ncbi:exopolyphosphatase PRUNE1-like isoform X3 [Calliopsis andreniformis]
MNIPEREYRVKTEVVYFLKRHDIPSNLLTFRDQIDLIALKDKGIDMEVVLVDHHSLPDEDIFLKDNVVRVIDHRPRDPRWPWPGKEVHLEIVGSCATLVARSLFGKHPEVIDTRLSNLLRGPILIDTSNFSKEADRATPIDVEIVETLEKVGKLDLDRNKAFNEIIKAKTDISHLTPDDLLIKDLKVTGGVPIVGLPMLVKNFLELRDDILKTIRNFAESRNTTIVILIGMEVDLQRVARDVAIFSLTSGQVLKEKLIEALMMSKEPSLDLTLTKVIHEEDGSCSVAHYTQGNLRVTRKQLLPIVQDTLLSQCQC